MVPIVTCDRHLLLLRDHGQIVDWEKNSKLFNFILKYLILSVCLDQTWAARQLDFITIATSRDTADRTFLTWYIPIIKDLDSFERGDILHHLEYDFYEWEKRQL